MVKHTFTPSSSSQGNPYITSRNQTGTHAVLRLPTSDLTDAIKKGQIFVNAHTFPALCFLHIFMSNEHVFEYSY